MRFLAAAAAVAFALAARADSAQLSLAEGQVATLEFARMVKRVAVTDDAVVDVKTSGDRKLVLTGEKGGRISLLVTFDDGAKVTFDVRVAGATRAAAAADEPPPNTFVLRVGETKSLSVEGLSKVLMEGDESAVDVNAHGSTVDVTGKGAGTVSLVLVDATGQKTTYTFRVR